MNEKHYMSAKEDLSKVLTLSGVVDVECLVKRSYCHLKLKDLDSGIDDIKTAQSASIHRAALVPEFVNIYEYIAQQHAEKGKLTLAISGLSKALSVLPDDLAPVLLVWRSFIYLEAGKCEFRADLDKARRLNYKGIKDRTIVNCLLSQEKVGGEAIEAISITFPEPLAQPGGAFEGEFFNNEGEQERYKGQKPAERARYILQALANVSRFIIADATESDKKSLQELTTLQEAGSRFAEEAYHQSDGFETIKALICSPEASYEERSLAMRILKVASKSGNRRLCKVFLRDTSLLDSLMVLVRSCSAEVISEMAHIHYCPAFLNPMRVPGLYRVGVLAKKSVDLLFHLSMCANKHIAQDLVGRGMAKAFREMHDVYETYWSEGINEGEGLFLGCLRDAALTAIDHIMQLGGFETNGRSDVSKKNLRDVTRAGQRCSNPDCSADARERHHNEHNAALSLCSRCNINGYCSVDCHRRHWPVHKVHCKKRGNIGDLDDD